MLKKVKLKAYEIGFLFKEGAFERVLENRSQWIIDPLMKYKVEVYNTKDLWFVHNDLNIIRKSEKLSNKLHFIDLKDKQRALVWVNGRFHCLLRPGLYAAWTIYNEIKVEVVDITEAIFTHPQAKTIASSGGNSDELISTIVEEGMKGIYTFDGEIKEVLNPGAYLFWKNAGKVKVQTIDLRESVIDVAGQDIMTKDKVTLRLNAVLSFKVIDPVKAIRSVDDFRQALYRETQLAIRAIVGSHDLDALLSEKETVSKELEKVIKLRAETIGVSVVTLGIKDIILPGDMKELLNKVIEAQKAADANLISRREETAAMRNQANTAKILENNPTLMRLKELDLLEKIAGNSKLSVVLTEKGFAEKVMNLL